MFFFFSDSFCLFVLQKHFECNYQIESGDLLFLKPHCSTTNKPLHSKTHISQLFTIISIVLHMQLVKAIDKSIVIRMWRTLTGFLELQTWWLLYKKAEIFRIPRMFHWILSAMTRRGRVTGCCLNLHALIFQSSTLTEELDQVIMLFSRPVSHFLFGSCCRFGRGVTEIQNPSTSTPTPPNTHPTPTPTHTPFTSSSSDGWALRR